MLTSCNAARGEALGCGIVKNCLRVCFQCKPKPARMCLFLHPILNVLDSHVTHFKAYKMREEPLDINFATGKAGIACRNSLLERCSCTKCLLWFLGPLEKILMSRALVVVCMRFAGLNSDILRFGPETVVQHARFQSLFREIRRYRRNNKKMLRRSLKMSKYGCHIQHSCQKS